MHAGFNRVAKSVTAEIDASLANKNPSKIHVVGHSLGGAVANLLAASFAARKFGVGLYTFGAPRPGLTSFREYLTAQVREENIYRAFNMSAPVPLAPIHPFLDIPISSHT